MPRRGRWLVLLAVVILALLVAGIFHPILGFEFVDFDTNKQVVKNPHIRGLTLENLGHIFTERCVTSYYPVRTLTYALDYQIWGLNPGRFKLTNGLIHLANVLLVFWLARRLLHHPAAAGRASALRFETPAAALCAALFAVHPVVVEPVAWVPGREELLMTLGALGCIHFHLTARRLDEPGGTTLRRRASYAGTAFCCAAACLSNAVGAAIPLLITSWDALTLQRPKLRKILRGTAALWVIAAATVLLKGWCIPSDAVHTVPRVFSFEWLLMIPSAYWLNLQTLVRPTELGILYEWIPSYGFRKSELMLGGLALALTPVVLWSVRRRTLIVFGLVWFLVALAPTSQIMPHHIARADRFLYLPLVGLAVTLAAAGASMGSTPARAASIGAIGLAVLLAAAWLSAGQVQTWQNSYTMWKNCLRVSPQNPMAHRCFAEILAKRGRFDEAIPHYHMALRVEPDSVPTLHSFALRLATCEEELRDCGLAIRLAERGCELTDWNDPDLRRTLAMAYTGSAGDLYRHGDHERAIEHYRLAIEVDPDYDVALLNLAMLLATCGDPKLRRPEEAVRLAERGCDLAGQSDPHRLRILATAYGAAGQGELAVATLDKAMRLAGAIGDQQMAFELRSQRDAYQQGAPEQNLP